MRPEPAGVYRSTLDEERFGIRVARVGWMTREILPEALRYCRDEGISLLMAKCMGAERRTVHAMEQAGFLLMETMLCLAADVRRPLPAKPGDVHVRPFRPDDRAEILRLAASCFRGYESHYHADDRLDRSKCDEIQVDWARRACDSRAVADEVIVAECEGSLGGYVILKRNSPEEVDAAVAAVVQDQRGTGIYEALTIHTMYWAAEAGAERITGHVQATNVAVQRTPMKLGWSPRYAYFTFHKWFSPEPLHGEH